MNEIGHNNPPTMIECANTLSHDVLAVWLRDTPVVETEDHARDGKVMLDRARLGIQDLEAERKKLKAPLLEEGRKIDDKYRSPMSLLEKMHRAVKERLDAWFTRETQRKEKEAEAARKAEADALVAAIAAEEAEQEAEDDARHGVSVDLASIAGESHHAGQELERAQREAARAEMATRPRLGGGLGKAVSQRTKSTIIIEDPYFLVCNIGFSERLLEALQREVNILYREKGAVPPGCKLKIERSL